MSLVGALAFNLLVNAVGSFVLAAAVALGAVRLLRLREGRWKQLFLLMPLAKVAIDLGRGVPEGSFFWWVLVGERQELGSYRIGFGLERIIPVVDLALGAFRGGFSYHQSMADVLAAGLMRRSFASAPELLAAAILSVGVGKLALRVTRAAFALADGERLRRSARCIDPRVVGGREVAIMIADGYAGVPFASGLLRPYVCLPGQVHARLSLAEREAVIGHELGHLAGHDLLLFSALGVFEDLLWFVPGLGALCRAVRDQSEICADEAAIVAGTSPEALASALVRVSELVRATPSAPALGLVRTTPLLARRVLRLVGSLAEPAPRFLFGTLPGRLALSLWIFAIIVRASGCGNHLARFSSARRARLTGATAAFFSCLELLPS